MQKNPYGQELKNAKKVSRRWGSVRMDESSNKGGDYLVKPKLIVHGMGMWLPLHEKC